MFFDKLSKITLIYFSISIFFFSSIQANDKNLKLRVERIERMLEQQMKSSLVIRLNQLQKENQHLRSLLEEQTYQNEKMNKRINSLLNDFDNRISDIENSGNQTGFIGKKQNLDESLTNNVKDNLIEKSKEVKPFAQKNDHLENKSNKLQPNQVNDVNNNLEQNKELTQANQSETYTENKQIQNVEDEEQLFNIQQAYKQAFNELKSSKYAKAEILFNDFLSKYPNNIYTDVAQYWLAETNYIQRNFNKAIQNYQKIRMNSGKYKESRLKIAYCYYELKNRAKAKEIANEVIKKYPKSSEAKQAKYLLKQIK